MFEAKSAPKDKKNTGKALDLRKWTLHDYIAVAHELKWVSTPVRDISAVLKDYRNLIHPYEELLRDTNLTPA